MKATKNPKLVLDGYDYGINKRKHDRTVWKCISYYKTCCKAGFTTIGRNLSITTTIKHNHEPRYTENDLINMKSQLVNIIQK